MYKRYKSGWMKHLDFLLLDTLMLQAAFVFAYWCRQGFKSPYAAEFYQRISFLLIILNVCVAFFDEGYEGILRRGTLVEFGASVKHVALVVGLLLVYLFTIKQNAVLSRWIAVYLSVFSLALIWLSRCGLKKLIKKQLAAQPSEQYHMLVLTCSGNVSKVLDSLKDSTYVVCGLCLADQDLTDSEIAGVPVVANMDNLLDYIKAHVVDGLFVDLPKDVALPSRILDGCTRMGVTTHIGLLSSDSDSNGSLVERIGNYTVLTSCVQAASARQLFLKRAMDVCAGLVGLVVIALCCVTVGPAIYIASPGPIFFSQTRVGKNGRKFKIYKFRSMYMDAEERKKELMAQNKIADGMMFKMDDDPRIIKGVGHFIRDYSIDELPQLWNVLKGDMSLVGTRPPTVEEYEKYDYHHKIRLSTKPGITGMWQVSGRSNITDFEQVVALDAKYITNWDLGLDIKILLKTVKVVLKKDGAS